MTTTQNVTHTPGPWQTMQHLADQRRHLVVKTDPRNRGDSAAYAVVADCQPANRIGEAEALANAQLIAAAPELLEACKRCIAEITAGAEFPEALYGKPGQLADEQADTLSMLRAAIAKATGNA